MNLTPKTQKSRRLLLALTCAFALVPAVWSQTKEPTPVETEAAKAKAAADAEAAKKLPVETTPAAKPIGEDNALVLSPFVVTTAKDAGYFAENTLAGSRLNSNLADLAASITVVTKQQMEDTASLDINDVFKFEANTEGSSSYTPLVTDRGTAKDTVSNYTLGNDGGTTTNSQSNRVRGLSAPDAAINYYPSNSRIPFDSYNTQSVEISRGPNSLLFGLGSPSGIVNQSASQAVLNRDTNNVSLRTDAYGSFRTSFSLNRSLIENKLAVYLAFLYNDQQFQRKPSYELTRRQYASVTYKPFKKTTIRAFAENFKQNSNRPNFMTPRDFVTPWVQSGRPIYDSSTRLITNLDGGRVTGPYYFDTRSPGYNSAVTTLNGSALWTNTTSPYYVQGIGTEAGSRPVLRIDGDNMVDYFMRNPVLPITVWSNPAQTAPTPSNQGWVANDPRFLMFDKQWTSSGSRVAPTVVVGGVTYTQNYQYPGISNKAIYDWTKYNTNQANFGRLRAGNYNIELEQELLPNLFLNAGWFRQDIDSAENYTISQTTGATLQIDTNAKLPDGRANPYVGLPFLTDSAPDTFYQPETDDNMRAMLAYDLDLTKHNNWLKYLGRHRLLGMWANQTINKTIERWRLGWDTADADGKLRFFSNPLVNNATTNWNIWNMTNVTRSYYLASPGDAQATVSHSTGSWGNKGWENNWNTSVQVYNYATGQFQNDVLSQRIHFADNGSYRFRREVESYNLALQSYLWGDRLVSTIGWRHDAYQARRTTGGALQNPDNTTAAVALTAAQIYDPASGEANYGLVMNRWNRWEFLKGDTKTVGAAFRPLKGWNFIERPASQGSKIADILRGMTLYYNQSDNFNPPPGYATDLFFRPLEKPTGKGKDIGLGFSMLNNKLVARISWFETQSQNERTSAAGTLLTRIIYGDSTLMQPWATTVVRLRHGANTTVTNWNSETVNPTGGLENEIWALMGLPRDYYSGLSVAGTQQSKATGVEMQVTYNPVNNWTMKFTGGKQETMYNSIAPQYDAWLAVRMPVWLAAGAPEIADFTDGSGKAYSLRSFWTSYGYTTAASSTATDGNTNAGNYFNNTVVSQVSLAKALEGVVAPNQRKYRGSFLTNYTFTKGKMKGVSIGGSERWESRAAVGFLGRAADPLVPTLLNAADPTKPVYLDNGNYYTDLWVSYTRKIYHDKVKMKLQLNCDNITEDGHLQAISVNYDGQPWAFRIIDSRQFKLTASFDF